MIRLPMRKEDIAYSRLISAAPELLEALKDIANDSYLVEFGETWQYKKALKAISKAEGKK